MDSAALPDGAPTALEITDLAVHIGGLVILERMSLSVPKGKIVSLIGPNGAGKTTAFNIITGYMTPSAGSVRFEGHDLLGMTPDDIAALGLVRTFQRTSIFAGCSVADNVLTAMHLRGRCGLFGAIFRTPSSLREEARLRAEVDDVLHFVGLQGRAGENAGSLAYGEQRLLGLAIALAARPKLLLLDEPAAGLNPSETERFKELVRLIRDDGVTVLLVEHNMHMVMSVSDKVFVLNQGRIIASGPPAAIQSNPEVIKAYLGTGLKKRAKA
ncbi:MAG: ABC transporter ATP-binding protein [Pseudorhodoplanes sp.]|nr:ABC transporter ATP-binding protein [Pseudorhodoplanes sp.]